jgi:hypothetical protein
VALAAVALQHVEPDSGQLTMVHARESTMRRSTGIGKTQAADWQTWVSAQSAFDAQTAAASSAASASSTLAPSPQPRALVSSTTAATQPLPDGCRASCASPGDL